MLLMSRRLQRHKSLFDVKKLTDTVPSRDITDGDCCPCRET